MQLFVGLSAHRGSIKRYAFDVLELLVSNTFPRDKTLREMRASRPDLVFSLRLHPDVVRSGLAHPDVERACVAREVLEARVIVLTTPPRFSPTTSNRRVLSDFARKLSTDKCFMAWEPRGVWSNEELEELAAELGILIVRDLAREPAPSGPHVYTRLLALGSGARISQHATETLASALEDKELAFVIIEGQGAKATRGALRDWFELEDAD